MPDRTATGGDALALEVGGAVQLSVRAHQQRGAIGVGFVHRDGLDRRPRGQHEQQRRIADDAGVDGAGIERLGQRCGGGKLSPVNVIGQIAQGVGGLQLGAHIAFLVADTQGQALAGGSLAGQQRSGGKGQQLRTNGHGAPRCRGGRRLAARELRL